MSADHLTLASVSPPRPLSRESAARIAGYAVMAWRYDRMPSTVDANLLRHYARSVVDGWLQSGELASTFDLWMDLKIYVAGDVALKALCASAPQPRFAGAGLLAQIDIDDSDTQAGETFNVLWHAADAEEVLAQPVMRTALVQLFDALQRQPVLSAAEIKTLLDWDNLCGRFEQQDNWESLEAAAAAAGEDWLTRQRSKAIEQRTAAE